MSVLKLFFLLRQNSEENKLIYTDIFNEYTVEIEKYIEAALVQVDLREIVPFLQMTNCRKCQISTWTYFWKS